MYFILKEPKTNGIFTFPLQTFIDNLLPTKKQNGTNRHQINEAYR